MAEELRPGRLYATGDTHRRSMVSGRLCECILGRFEDEWLRQNDIEPKELCEKDVILITGDVGICWTGDEQDTALIKYLSRRSASFNGATIAMIDGNHDNHNQYKSYPEITWNGARAHQLAEGVVYIERGEIFTFEGKTFLCIGGAESSDRAFRTEGLSWWPTEKLSCDDMANIWRSIQDTEGKVDFVITHTGPQNFLDAFGLARKIDQVAMDLFEIYRELQYGKWVFGHLHLNRELPDYNAACVFDRYMRLV